MTKEDEIKIIAYNIWEQQSCPAGKIAKTGSKPSDLGESRTVYYGTKKPSYFLRRTQI
jgi:hypothetical protein